MAKIHFIIEDDKLGKESILADGAVYTLFRVDPQTNQPQFMMGTEGNLKEGIVLANMLAATRNYVMEVLGVQEDQEELFDKSIRQTAEEIRNLQTSPDPQTEETGGENISG